MGVVVGGYIDILTIINNFPYSTCIIQIFFWQQHPYFFVHLLNVFLLYIKCTKITLMTSNSQSIIQTNKK